MLVQQPPRRTTREEDDEGRGRGKGKTTREEDDDGRGRGKGTRTREDDEGRRRWGKGTREEGGRTFVVLHPPRVPVGGRRLPLAELWQAVHRPLLLVLCHLRTPPLVTHHWTNARTNERTNERTNAQPAARRRLGRARTHSPTIGLYIDR